MNIVLDYQRERERTEAGTGSLEYMTSISEDPSWHRNTTVIRAEGVGGLAGFWVQRQSGVVNESKVLPMRWGSHHSLKSRIGVVWSSHPPRSWEEARNKPAAKCSGSDGSHPASGGREGCDTAL